MITIDIKFGNPEIFDDTREFFRRAPDLFRRKVPSAARRISRFSRPLLRQTVPGPVAEPIEWFSEKQRIAYFASNGFDAGIPYQRTGRLIDAWRVETDIDADGGIWRFVNDLEYAQYVYGPRQQPFHFNTGWRPLPQTSVWPEIIDFAESETVNLHQSLIADYLEATQ